MDQFSSLLESVLKVEPTEPQEREKALPQISEQTPNPNPQQSMPNGLSKRRSSNYETWINNAWNYGSKADDLSEKSDKKKTDFDISNLWNSGKDESSTASAPGGNPFTDKLMEKVIQIMIPTDVNGEQSNTILKERIEMQKSRPPLSMNTMSNNSIQLNSRLSAPFYGIDLVINFFDWSSPSFTIGVLLVATHIILNPYLLSVLPFLLLIQNTLVPHYLMIYLPDVSLVPEYLDFNPEPATEPIEKFKVPKPVPQFSREFILNLTDLQNHQLLYIATYDFFVWLTTDYLYFKDENISSIVYLGLLAMMFSNLLLGPMIFAFLLERTYLLKMMAILSIWAISISGYPTIRGRILEWLYKEDTRLNFQHFANSMESSLLKHFEPNEGEQETDLPTLKQVEIFELQKLDNKTRIWYLVGFANNFYTFNISSRKVNASYEEAQKKDLDVAENEAGDDSESITSQRGYLQLAKAKSLDDIRAPTNWIFQDKKWSLDLDVNEWVNGNLINDLVLIDEDEKWVYDFQQEDETEVKTEKGPKEIYRRRRWIRNCRRETYKERCAKDEKSG